MLTQEQIEQTRQKLNITPNKPKSSKPSGAEYAASLNRNIQNKKQVEEYKQTPQGKNILNKLADISSKFLGFGAKVTGATSAVDLVGTVGQGMQYGMSKLIGDKAGAQIALEIPTTESLTKAYTQGTGAGVKDVLGKTLEVGTNVATFGAAPASIGGRILKGAELGAAYGTSSALQEDKKAVGIIGDALKGATVGAVVSGVFEGLGYLARKTNVGKYTLDKELGTDKKEIANAIANDFKTKGQEISQVVDDKGKRLYVGTYKQMMDKAKMDLNKQTPLLNERVKMYPNVKMTRDEVAGDIITQYQNKYGQLTDLQLKTIKNAVNKLPQNMNPEQATNAKRMFDGFISKADWAKIAAGTDSQLSFAHSIYYTLRDNLRNMINTKTADPVIQQLNNRISMAIDVKALTSLQLATRALRKISGEGGFFYKLIGRTIDDVLFNPAVTTRGSAFMQGAGEKTGQTLLRQGTRAGIIKGFSE